MAQNSTFRTSAFPGSGQGVYGDFEKDIDAGLNKDPETTRQNLKLYLDGVPMAGLLPEILSSEAAIGLEKIDPKPKYVLRYVLNRNSNEELNRKSWDNLIPLLLFGPQGLQVGVGLNGKVHLTTGPDLQFQIGDPVLINWVVWIGIGLLLVGMVAVIRFGIVRENGPGTPYSLGKTQMAFWGILVAISFIGVWTIGHRMERIPPQVLILLGISGTTGLGSVLINSQPGRALAANSHPVKGWFRDIISDGNGVNFQRFQVVVWTLILGFVFAWTVANSFSMPEFENTLLVLMGISNGLYLGFKNSEEPK